MNQAGRSAYVRRSEKKENKRNNVNSKDWMFPHTGWMWNKYEIMWNKYEIKIINMKMSNAGVVLK